MCPELTQDVPRVKETGHTQKGIFILAERSVENAKMAKVNTTKMIIPGGAEMASPGKQLGDVTERHINLRTERNIS